MGPHVLLGTTCTAQDESVAVMALLLYARELMGFTIGVGGGLLSRQSMVRAL